MEEKHRFVLSSYKSREIILCFVTIEVKKSLNIVIFVVDWNKNKWKIKNFFFFFFFLKNVGFDVGSLMLGPSAYLSNRISTVISGINVNTPLNFDE